MCLEICCCNMYRYLQKMNGDILYTQLWLWWTAHSSFMTQHLVDLQYIFKINKITNFEVVIIAGAVGGSPPSGDIYSIPDKNKKGKANDKVKGNRDYLNVAYNYLA